MIRPSFPPPPRLPWLLIAPLLIVLSYPRDGDRMLAAADAAEAPSLPPYPSLKQPSVGAQLAVAAEIYFNQTTTLRCDLSESTPGYITTVLLSNPPFVFGCLSEVVALYHFSVAFSGLNFPNTPVWVANRHHPVTQDGFFVLVPQGSAFVENGNGTVVWSSNTDRLNAVGLRLTSEGNLVLFDKLNTTLWASFWEPIDLLVPGQALPVGGALVAGFSSHVSTTGDFTAVMRKGGLVLYENSTSQALPYYALGYPVVATTMDAILNSPCNHTRLVLDTTNVTQIQVPDSPACRRPSSSTQLAISFGGPIVFIRLEPNGLFKGYFPDHRPSYDLFQNSSIGACRIPNACGPYGICEDSRCRCPGNDTFDLSHAKDYLLNSTSCVPKVPASCRHEDGRGLQYFLDVGTVDYFANDFIEPTMLVDSLDACKMACLGNCSCQAAFYRKSSKHCFLHEAVMSIIAVRDPDYVGAIKLYKPEPEKKKSPVGLAAYISISMVALIVLLGVWYYYHRKKKRALNGDDDELLACLPGQLRKLSYKELQVATWEFSQKLGVGGFGSVYKGVLPDGSFVAVKQLENTTRFTQGMKEFRNEVIALGNINHQNLVHLRGFCADSGRHLLVYEYVSNGSLDTWLFCKGAARPGPPLDWKKRIAIAVQTARGLTFLHEQCRNRIVHLDIKPQNILLDENFAPKLSDFGLSRLMNEDNDSAMSRMRGTPGYMAPECLILTDATEKSDVYSFGMVLLEIVSGRKNVDVSRLTVHGDCESWYFPAFASRKLKEGNAVDIVDRSLLQLDLRDMAEATRVLQIAFWCIQDNPSLRPTIGKALLMLEGYSKVRPPPLSFHFGMRFHLCNSISPPNVSPANSALHGDSSKIQHAEDIKDQVGAGSAMTWKDSDDKGEPTDAYSLAQSLQGSSLSSRQTSPISSPMPWLSSHNSFPPPEGRHSSRPSPLSHNPSPTRSSQKASPLQHHLNAAPPRASPSPGQAFPHDSTRSPMPHRS